MLEVINGDTKISMTWTIYKHTSPEGKSYIGQTCQKNVNQRWRDGKGYIENKQPLFKNAIIKYGWSNFKHEILEKDIKTLEEANKKEKYYIDLFRTYIGFKDCNGYNMTPGGDSKGGSWFEEEDRIIRCFFPLEGQECYKRLNNRTAGQVRNRASKLGIHSEINTYTNEDDEIIKQLYPSEGTAVVKRLSKKHSKTAVAQRAIKLGVKYKQNSWSESEIELLKSDYEITTFDGLAILLGNREIHQIKYMARKLGLTFKKKSSWSEEEDYALKQLFPVFGRNSYKYIKGRSVNAVANRAKILGLKKQLQKIILIELNKTLTFKELEENYKINHSTAIRACQNINKTAGGYHFCYEEDTVAYNKLKHFVGSKKKIYVHRVKRTDKEGNEYIYDSAADAYRKTGIRHIPECCRGELKTAGGSHWEYLDE